MKANPHVSSKYEIAIQEKLARLKELHQTLKPKDHTFRTPQIYIEAPDVKEERYESLAKYKAQYEHALWKTTGDLARKNGGHGGMDFIMVYRVVQCLQASLAPDMDVYDAAAWSVPGPLSELSVAKGSAPVKFPDFTRGRWRTLPG